MELGCQMKKQILQWSVWCKDNWVISYSLIKSWAYLELFQRQECMLQICGCPEGVVFRKKFFLTKPMLRKLYWWPHPSNMCYYSHLACREF